MQRLDWTSVACRLAQITDAAGHRSHCSTG
jgi:hypothetical protein